MHFEISHAEHRQRYARLQEAMATAGVDTLLSWAPENIYYLTGFDSLGYYFPQCLVASVDADPVLVVRHFETPNVEMQTWLTDYVGYRDHEDVAQVVAKVAARFGPRVATEAETWSVSPGIAARVSAALDGRVTPISGLVEGLRVVKSATEIELIRHACRFTEAGMAAAFDASRVGSTEDDVAAALYHAMISAGSSYPSLAPFVATGPRTAQPHATWSGRPIQEGDMLFYEPGGSAGRYSAGLIRVGVVGEVPQSISATVDSAVAVVTEALEALMAAIKPGVTGQEVHLANRDVIKGSGWGDIHRNRSGYSIGVSYPPDWGEGHIYSLRHMETRPLEPGMVFHIVPNVMIPDVAGIGVSETVLVTENGCEALTQYPRELIRVEPTK